MGANYIGILAVPFHNIYKLTPRTLRQDLYQERVAVLGGGGRVKQPTGPFSAGSSRKWPTYGRVVEWSTRNTARERTANHGHPLGSRGLFRSQLFNICRRSLCWYSSAHPFPGEIYGAANPCLYKYRDDGVT